MTDQLYETAKLALATWVASAIVDNAKENQEDPLTYSTDDEIVELYARDMALEVSKLLPALIKKIVKQEPKQ